MKYCFGDLQRPPEYDLETTFLRSTVTASLRLDDLVAKEKERKRRAKGEGGSGILTCIRNLSEILSIFCAYSTQICFETTACGSLYTALSIIYAGVV